MKSAAAFLGDPEIWLMMFDPFGDGVISMSYNEKNANTPAHVKPRHRYFHTSYWQNMLQP
jgi:hypothetical protein